MHLSIQSTVAGRGLILLSEQLHFKGEGPRVCNLLLKPHGAQSRAVTHRRMNSPAHLSAQIAHKLSSLPSHICKTPVSEMQGI